MTRPCIWLVEDNPDDIALMRMALRECQPPHDLVVLQDGQAALELIQATGPDGGPDGHPLPRLVLLDLKIPIHDGHEVLRTLRASSWARHLPVVVLTTSALVVDIDRAYEAGANAFVPKPVDFSDLIRLVQALTRFWLSFNQLHHSLQ